MGRSDEGGWEQQSLQTLSRVFDNSASNNLFKSVTVDIAESEVRAERCFSFFEKQPGLVSHSLIRWQRLQTAVERRWGATETNISKASAFYREFKNMNCTEASQIFSLYIDNQLETEERQAVNEHLLSCPVCRAELDAERSVVNSLRKIATPRVPVNLSSSISRSLRIESAAKKSQPELTFREFVWRWIRPRIMPYAIGTFASLLFFSFMFMGLRNSLMAFRAQDYAQQQPIEIRRVLLENGGVVEYAVYSSTTPRAFAEGRAPFSYVSPSLNPNGALAELTMSPYLTNSDDDMVVVTDVFANGIASLAGIIQPPRDPRMIDEFQRALKKNPAFVPADYDGRPQTIRVVFVVQKIAVNEVSY